MRTFKNGLGFTALLAVPVLLGVLFFFVMPKVASANEQTDAEVIARIKEQAYQHSEAWPVLLMLADVYGPRLAGTPSYREMVDETAAVLRSWGLDNVSIESIGTIRGWEPIANSASMTAPKFMPLIAQPICCSASTEGAVVGEPVVVDFYDLDALKALSGTLTGKILMHPAIPPSPEANTGTWPDEKLAAAARRISPVTPDGLDGPGSTETYADRLRADHDSPGESDGKAIARFLIDEKVGAVILSSRLDRGVLSDRIDSSIVEFTGAEDPEPTPFFVLAKEQHARILRLIEAGENPNLRLSAETRYYNDPDYNVNVIAEIRGSGSKSDEIVLIGAHLDSVSLGGGAADNGAGAATMIEVMRILRALDVQPRRTIRLALWGGEEIGLLGSSAYVHNTIGDILTGKYTEEHKKISVYLNADYNGHDIRGILLLGHEAIKPIFESYLEPFADIGASTVTIENACCTDHIVFDATGIPSFEWIYDPQHYFTHQLHTNLDYPDLIDEGTLKRNAAIIASVVYHVAMREELLPRKVKSSAK